MNYEESYPNGESPKDFYERIKDAFLDLIKNNQDKEVVIITHGGVYGIIKSIINGIRWNNRQKYKIDHGEMIEFKVE